MDVELMLWPVIVQVFLTIAVFILLGIRKLKSVKAGTVDLKKTALDNSAWPDDVRKVSNNIQNQFQLPVIFYVLVFAFIVMKAVTVFVLVVA